MDARATARWTLLALPAGIVLYYTLVNIAYAVAPRPGADGVGLDILLIFLAVAVMACAWPVTLWVAWRPVKRRPVAAACLGLLAAGAAVLGSLFVSSAGAPTHVPWVTGAVLWGWAVAQGWLAAAIMLSGARRRTPETVIDSPA